MADVAALREAPDPRFLASGDDAGTPTGDRKFRPDVQGLRAVAIVLVLLFHADIPGFTGGYVGVDVFFVISGFVITGLLLRESEFTGKTSILSFYGRRARRIIPAASLVIVVTVAATFIFVGSATGRQSAVDGQWASVFLANFHFAASQTNYLASLQPPSPLQNYWSLAVEEQFYVIYPTIFLLVAGVFVRTSLRLRVGLVLAATVIGSFVLSILMTASDPATAFFSPFTRAWELALGGVIALSHSHLRRLPEAAAAALTWLGLGAILFGAFAFTSATPYPGSAAAIPVVGAGLIIAGGSAQPEWGVETLLRRRPLQLLGLISYSLYLWHWPILIIATQDRGVQQLPVGDNVLLLAVALVAAIGTYLILENPVRHSVFLVARRWASVIMGLVLIVGSLAVTTVAVASTRAPATGGIGNAVSGSNCRTPPSRQVAGLRARYLAGRPSSGTAPNGRPLRMAVVGDSTACTMLDGLEAVAPSYNIRVGNGAVIGCGIVSDTLAPQVPLNAYTQACQQRAEQAESAVIRRQRPDIILWGSTDEGSSIVDPPSGTRVLRSGTPQWEAVMLQRIDARLRFFTARGAKVILLLEPPEVHQSGSGGAKAEDRRYGRLNSLLRRAASQYPTKVAVVDLSQLVCPSGPPCPYAVDGVVVRPDNLHYGPNGALWVAERLMPQIVAAAKSLR